MIMHNTLSNAVLFGPITIYFFIFSKIYTHTHFIFILHLLFTRYVVHFHANMYGLTLYTIFFLTKYKFQYLTKGIHTNRSNKGYTMNSDEVSFD